MDFPRLKGLPPYILGSIVAKMMDARRAGADIINLGMGNPDLPTPQFIVDRLCSAAQESRNHRYSVSKGIHGLRCAMAEWYERHYNVVLDPEREVVATMGSKDGMAHLVLSISGPGDTVLVPEPTYPIHTYAAVIAGAHVAPVPLADEDQFLRDWKQAFESRDGNVRLAILSFPANPTTQIVSLAFFEEAVRIAKHYKVPLIHDLAYADMVFGQERAPSILQVPGAKEHCVECYTLSKSYSMPGWRVAFSVGNQEILAALTRMKSYMDYGIFQPVQIAAAVALRKGDGALAEIRDIYQHRRDVLCDGLAQAGWKIDTPSATMFAWAKIPDTFREMGSMAFAEHLLDKAQVCVSPGIGFGASGEGYVRFALVENEERIRQATRAIKKALTRGGTV